VIIFGRLPTVQILVSIGTVGAYPQIGKVLPVWDFVWDFFDCPILSFFLDLASRSNRSTDVHAFWLKRRAFTQEDDLREGGYDDRVMSFDISQGSVATHLSRCGGIFSDSIITHFLLILTVK